MAQGVAKGSSYRIRAIRLYTDCSLSERDGKIAQLWCRRRNPWPIKSLLLERDGNKDEKGTAKARDLIRIIGGRDVNEGQLSTAVFHNRPKIGDGTRIKRG